MFDAPEQSPLENAPPEHPADVALQVPPRVSHALLAAVVLLLMQHWKRGKAAQNTAQRRHNQLCGDTPDALSQRKPERCIILNLP